MKIITPEDLIHIYCYTILFNHLLHPNVSAGNGSFIFIKELTPHLRR